MGSWRDRKENVGISARAGQTKRLDWKKRHPLELMQLHQGYGIRDLIYTGQSLSPWPTGAVKSVVPIRCQGFGFHPQSGHK